MILLDWTDSRINSLELQNYLKEKGIKVDFTNLYWGKKRLMTHFYIGEE